MKLEKLILINWGFMVSREYPFGDTNLLSGSTGVGKSSFQDAIQLVMTGGKQHINVFNSAQDEAGGGGRAGGKVRRTLASYAVGMRDNLCVRPNGPTLMSPPSLHRRPMRRRRRLLPWWP